MYLCVNFVAFAISFVLTLRAFIIYSLRNDFWVKHVKLQLNSNNFFPVRSIKLMAFVQWFHHGHLLIPIVSFFCFLCSLVWQVQPLPNRRFDLRGQKFLILIYRWYSECRANSKCIKSCLSSAIALEKLSNIHKSMYSRYTRRTFLFIFLHHYLIMNVIDASIHVQFVHLGSSYYGIMLYIRCVKKKPAFESEISFSHSTEETFRRIVVLYFVIRPKGHKAFI